MSEGLVGGLKRNSEWKGGAGSRRQPAPFDEEVTLCCMWKTTTVHVELKHNLLSMDE